MRNIIFVGLVAAVLSGCATGSSTQNAGVPTPTQLAPVVASYSERVDAQALEQYRGGACPTDGKWETLSWQKMVSVAGACVKAKDFLKVEKIGDYLARSAHLTPWGPYFLALSAESRHDSPRAVWMLELALKKAPKEGIFHYELGRIQWEAKADQEAITHLKLASELSPSLTGAHWVLGQMAMQRNELSEADRLLQKALASNAEHGPSLLAMAQLKIQQKNWEQAEKFLGRAISVVPRNTKARMALAQLQELHLKKFEDALRTYKQLKQLVAERKLDEAVNLNLDEKIKSLMNEAGKVSQRQPAVDASKGPVKQ